MLDMLILAAKISLPKDCDDERAFWLGSVGIRNDGILVSSRNGAVYSTKQELENYQLIPNSHAEGRLVRKLDYNGVVYVARVRRQDNSLAMARPCGMCQTLLTSQRVKKVYYTIDPCHYGIWYPNTNKDKIISCSYCLPKEYIKNEHFCCRF